MWNFFKHLHIVNRHRWLVFKHCVKCGLFWQGLVHDLSKYSYTEFHESIKYFTGKGSPINGARKAQGYSYAWLHHKGRNKHHIEYWVDTVNGDTATMPYKYAVESICDRIAANKAYAKKDYKPELVLQYWQNTEIKKNYSPEMLAFFDKVLSDLCKNGEDAVLNKKYMKEAYKETVENAQKH